MSKAFTKETDDSDEDEGFEFSAPQGSKNYISPAGYARLRNELLHLMDKERPEIVQTVHWAAKNGDRSENGDYLYGKKRLREIDRRIRFLTKRLEIAEIVDASMHHGCDQIFFGASVTYEDESGNKKKVTILGIDEANILQSEVSWISPIAKAVLKARVGDVLRLQTPNGWQEIEITKVDYPSQST